MRRGFTLIEVVITLGIFSIASLMAVNVFVIFLQQQRRLVSQQELQGDARAIVEEISDQLREGVAHYAYYEAQFAADKQKLFTTLDGMTNECLVIIDPLNRQVRYRLNAGLVEKLALAAASTDSCDSILNGWVTVTPASLTVNSFTIAIAPTEDPYAAQVPLPCTLDTNCRWGTACFEPGGTYQLTRGTAQTHYCAPQKFDYGSTVGDAFFPFHPRVTFSLNVSRKAGQQTVSQTFQTTIASRIFKNADKFNRYAN
jgi:prepilin-type N-terminal cleavage/methylation domain-containing protein